MTDQEKRENLAMEMANILDELDCQNHNVCCRYEDDTLLCNRCCAERLADYILRKEEEVQKEVIKKISKWVVDYIDQGDEEEYREFIQNEFGVEVL